MNPSDKNLMFENQMKGIKRMYAWVYIAYIYIFVLNKTHEF